MSANTPHADLRRGTTRLVGGQYVTYHSAKPTTPTSRFVRTPGQTAQPHEVTARKLIVGVATYGRPRANRRPVEYEPKPTVCVCGTDPCPQNCPTREESPR